MVLSDSELTGAMWVGMVPRYDWGQDGFSLESERMIETGSSSGNSVDVAGSDMDLGVGLEISSEIGAEPKAGSGGTAGAKGRHTIIGILTGGFCLALTYRKTWSLIIKCRWNVLEKEKGSASLVNHRYANLQDCTLKKWISLIRGKRNSFFLKEREEWTLVMLHIADFPGRVDKGDTACVMHLKEVMLEGRTADPIVKQYGDQYKVIYGIECPVKSNKTWDSTQSQSSYTGNPLLNEDNLCSVISQDNSLKWTQTNCLINGSFFNQFGQMKENRYWPTACQIGECA